jgi:hypothetical protein
MRSAPSVLAASLLAATACASAPRPAPPAGAAPGAAPNAAPNAAPGAVTPDDVRAIVAVLAADSLEGRGTGTPGSLRAARVIADAFARAGLEPAGDPGQLGGYLQRVPMALGATPGAGGRRAVVLLPDLAALDTVPAARRLEGGNVVGVLRGADPALRDEAVLVDAHYDHLGVGAPAGGDSVYNGADDDASGTAAVMLVARALAAGPRPRRSVVFLAATGEEVGLVGTRHYIRRPAWPIARTVGNLEVEMIGRPDPLAGGAGRGWLTGYERSTVGEALAAAGVPIVADPRPAERFFERSDNIAFAWLGVPAHTLSSFALHADYHTPRDEADRLDYAHAARVVEAAARAVRLMADGPRPAWKAGGRPTPPPAARRMLGLEP